ncbi:MAG: DUF6754 domain-containing protein [Bacillota bacterium]
MLKGLSVALRSSWLKRYLFTANNLGLTSLILLTLYVGTLVYITYRARTGLRIPKVRRIAGLDAIDEAIGRATEMGRPVLFSPGMGGFETSTFAAFGVLGHVAKLVAKYDARMIVCNRTATVHPVTEAIVKQAYMEQGKPDAFKADDIRFLTGDQWGYAAGVVGIMSREGVAATVMVGYFYAESLVFAEAGFQAGAIQVAGTDSTTQIPFFIAACDYTLIGEEIYAASCYLSQDRIRTATLIAQDWGKQVVVGLITLGVLLASLKITFLTELLTLY